MKREGTYLTPAEQRRREEDQRKLAQMIAAGVEIPVHLLNKQAEDGSAENKEHKKFRIQRTKKSKTQDANATTVCAWACTVRCDSSAGG
jgi:hypothetical protein